MPTCLVIPAVSHRSTRQPDTTFTNSDILFANLYSPIRSSPTISRVQQIAGGFSQLNSLSTERPTPKKGYREGGAHVVPSLLVFSLLVNPQLSNQCPEKSSPPNDFYRGLSAGQPYLHRAKSTAR